MAAAYASLVSLMRLIHDLQHHPSPPISLDRRLVESITQHITFFQEFLHHYNSPRPVADDDEDAVDPLEMRIAAAAYVAEDAIESYIVDTIQQLRSNNDDGSKITHNDDASKIFLEFLQSYNISLADGDEQAADPLEMTNAAEDAIETHIEDTIHQRMSDDSKEYENIESINLCCDSLLRVIGDMDSIKKSVVAKVDTEKKKKKKVPVVHDQVAMTNVPSSISPNETMEGFDDVSLEIMEKLTGGRPDFQVIPIVGMGGIGKTFLANSIYTRQLIKEHFDICVWATISQQYNTREILCELLSQATKIKKEQLSGMSNVDELGLKLYRYLFLRRFLIVLDDMWSTDAWDMIQRFFPNNENGSRVLVTTRLSQLSSQLNDDDYSLHMNFLDESSSWGLFSKTVFGEKSCPPELKKIGEKIVDNCKGLPLSIAVVGGLLKNMDGTRSSWKSIRDNLSSVVNMDNEKHCLRLLKLSYNHLPVHLKPCFLHMGVFEEDKDIRVSMLVNLWISEGFLKLTDSEDSETTARGFLQDLVDRNLILIGKLGSTGSIKSCKIHDLVRDMCLKEGEEEGFYHVIGQCYPLPSPQGMNTQRRVVIPRNTSKENVCDQLRCMPYARSVISENDKVLPSISNLGLLRTLHANDLNGSYELNFLRFQHVNMRYLAIEYGTILSFEQVSLFWNLQTLILHGTNDDKDMLLVDFWKMPQLMHIELQYDYLYLLPDLPSDDDDDVVVMENLHTVKGVRNLKCSKGLVKRIPNIKKLQLGYYHLDVEDEYYLGNIKYLCRLESLFLRVHHVEYNKLTFPHSLKKLNLCMYGKFEWDNLMFEKIGSLPLLEKLKLQDVCFRKRKWETVEGQFPCLKYLELYRCSGLENWTAAEEESNILPRLEHLRIFNLTELEKIPGELGNIDTLRRIELVLCGEGAVKCAKEMVNEQLDLQGQLSFHVDVQLIYAENQQHLLSLAGPNFQVRKY